MQQEPVDARVSTERTHVPCNAPRVRGVCFAGLASFAPPANGADTAKTLRVVLTSAEMSFDPQFSADAGSDGIIDHIYDSMLDYDYLARPVKLVPRTLEAMPVVEDGGATFVFRFKRGIFFTPDPAFRGQPRELTAADQAYALKRLLDPAVKSPWLWLVEGKIIGADAVRASALKTGKFDYDAPIAGLEVVDRYTLRIRLKKPDLRFLYVFAVPNTAAVAREVVEAYGRDFGAHPVGTGPYMLGDYQRSARIDAGGQSWLPRDDLCARRVRCRRSRCRSPPRSREGNCRSSVASRSR